MKTLVLSRGAAAENSPGRSPWVRDSSRERSPGRGDTALQPFCRPCRGFLGLLGCYPGLTPWAKFGSPLPGLQRVSRSACGLALLGLLCFGSFVFAQSKSLDDQLLDDLKPVPAKTKAPDKNTDKPKTDKPTNKLDDALRRDLEGEDIGQEKKEEHPLKKLGREMREVQQRIGAQDTAEGTQQMQKAIAAELAQLIEQAQKKPQGGKSAGNNQPGNGSAQAGAESGSANSKPGQQSTQRLDKGEQTQTQMNEVKDALRRIWGHLPEKEREEMIGALGEQFLPKYERLIEDFYKRLAERPAARP